MHKRTRIRKSMKRHALFVGVNTYDDKSIRKLRYSIPDASVLADRFRGLGYKARLLSDPTGAELKSAVVESVDGLGHGDVFLFFFAGHGFTAQDGAHLLFCRDDMQRLLRVNAAGVRVDALEALTEGGGFHRAFLLDSCRTDCFAGMEGRGGGVTRDLDFVAVPECTEESGSYFLLRSCDKFRPSLELDGIGHGLFTQALLDAMDARDGRLASCDTSFAMAVGAKMSDIQQSYNVNVHQRPSMGECSGPVFSLFENGFLAFAEQVTPRQLPAFSRTAPALVVCPVCGKKNHPEDTFKCRECGRDNLCLRHQDEKTFLCINCAENMTRKSVEEVEQRHSDAQGQLLKTRSRHGEKEFSIITRKKTVRYMLTAFRDGFQCAMGGRVMAKHILPAVEAAYNAGVRWFEIGGGALFQTSFLYCQQNAFDVMDSFRAICPDAELQTLSRGPNIVGLESQPADIIALYAMLFRKHGVSAIRNYDALYDPNNLKIPGQHIRKAGMVHEVALGIMGIPPKLDIGYAHTPEFYAERMRSFLESGMPIDRVCIKDNSGTASPEVVFNTVRQIRRLLGDKMHIQFHTHDSIGMGKECCLAALKGGADGLDLSFAPLSGGWCQPDLVAMCQALQGNSEYRFDIDISKIYIAVKEFKEAIKIYDVCSGALGINKKLINIPVPGGTLAANMQMLVDNGVDGPYEKLVPEFAECFKRGGCAAASMTPVAQFYVQQAACNVAFGRFSRFAPGYAKLLLGYFGKLPVAPDPVLVNAASSFLAANPTTSAYARQAQRSVIELNNADQCKGIAPARRNLKENGLPITDENILIAATCKEKGLQFLKGNGPMGCRFTD